MAFRTSDKDPLAAKFDLRRASLGESTLAPLCLRALERLIDWAQHKRKEELHFQYRNQEVDFWDRADREKYSLEPGNFDTSGLADDSAEVLRAYQVKLRELDTGEPLPVGIAMSLSVLGSIARAAHCDNNGSRQRVKAVELDASAGEPRSICVGTRFSFDLDQWAATLVGRSTVASQAFGCFRVFRDTTHGSGGGHYWSIWCPSCKPSTGQRVRQSRTRIRRRWLEHALDLQARR